MIERSFEDKDQSSLLDLLRSTYNGWHIAEYWDWKFEQNPNGHPIIWVAEDEGKIIGCYMLNPVKIRIGRVSVLGAQSVDAAVDFAYRGQGIFKRLAINAMKQASTEGIAITYAFPTEIAYKGQISVGYQPAFVIPKMYKILNPSRLAEFGLGGRCRRKASNILGLLERLNRHRAHHVSKENLTIKQINHPDPRFGVFWRRISDENPYILIERDMDYLSWRYLRNPEKTYSVHICEENDEIVGYAVLSIDRIMAKQKDLNEGVSVGKIIDLLTLPNKSYAGLHLIAHALDCFQHEEVDIASCWMFKKHPYHAILRKFWFSDYYELFRRCVFRNEYIPQLIVCINSRATLEKASELKTGNGQLCWFIMQGDGDFA